ncbi:phosphonate transport system substrate-binding protein [Desulfosalsimonas propionicica]|uniref:Phosphonate transport system substrate-binding protein n=1 Tax=Desulfosalsimonas propionicica TaxID=332175 RepID=A0A7W0CCF8_9BACT|nr:phosphate/phosphite/phosphonate ABC transporter substrate-binding protein [Desulfosalsimonas propionicica]MBA2883186.1 phosphonate transport system substrate-binding protein [Desulfosalsimonas propionicica]
MKLHHAMLMLLLLVVPTANYAGEAYQLSMLPRYSSEEINQRINPLADYLTQKTGVQIEAVITSDFSQYEKRLKSGAIQMGYENPYIYTLVSDTHEVLAMAEKGKDRDKFRGIVIARQDSGISKLEDLRGKTISIVGLTSAGGYLSQKLSLSRVGIDVEKECTISEAMDNKQENVLLSVYTGEAEAGFIRESALHKADNYLPTAQIKVVAVNAWLPNWAFSVDKSLPEDLKCDIQAALLELDPAHPVIKALKIDRFRPARDSEYDEVRRASGMNPKTES